MVPALVLMLLAVAPYGPAVARRHAPDLREDEPARRTTRPAAFRFYNFVNTTCAIDDPLAVTVSKSVSIAFM
ncbi:unnamed protein product [Pieris macdunnoughi]|uniref:Secreted protein n=1 Tax=Pieris macdunnoughi TaxID=345717 RepID=A0A821V8P7_9NEOP|nr:unnamed protein product [Pieris macdunnoughi]